MSLSELKVLKFNGKKGRILPGKLLKKRIRKRKLNRKVSLTFSNQLIAHQKSSLKCQRNNLIN